MNNFCDKMGEGCGDVLGFCCGQWDPETSLMTPSMLMSTYEVEASMNQDLFILLSLLLGPAGFLGMLYCYRKAYVYAGESHKLRQKLLGLESEVFALAGKNQQQATSLADAVEEKNIAMEQVQKASQSYDSLASDHKKICQQVTQLQNTLSLLQNKTKKLEETLEGSEKKYRSELDTVQKKVASKNQEIEMLRKELDSNKAQWELEKNEGIKKETLIKNLEATLASEKQKLRKSEDYNLEILAEIVVIQGELKTLQEQPSEADKLASMQSELARQINASMELREQLERQIEKTSAFEADLTKAQEVNQKWESTIKELAEHIIGRRLRTLENQTLGELINNAYAAISRTKVLLDHHQSEKNQSDELDYLAKLTSQSGLYRGKNPAKDNS